MTLFSPGQAEVADRVVIVAAPALALLESAYPHVLVYPHVMVAHTVR
jgi:hypothetical protein